MLHVQGQIQTKSLLHLQPGENLNLLEHYCQNAQVVLLLLSPDTDVEKILNLLPHAAPKIFCLYLRPVLSNLTALLANHQIPIVPTKPISYYTHKEQALTYAEKHFFKWLYRTQPGFKLRTKIKLMLLKIMQSK